VVNISQEQDNRDKEGGGTGRRNKIIETKKAEEQVGGTNSEEQDRRNKIIESKKDQRDLMRRNRSEEQDNRVKEGSKRSYAEEPNRDKEGSSLKYRDPA
jgi:hypothetical protein